MTRQDIVQALAYGHAARAAAAALDEPARALEAELGPAEVVEVFRRVAAREIVVGGYLTSVGEAVTHADLENQLVMVPFLCRLLVKYETLLQQHRAKPSITTFPPDE